MSYNSMFAPDAEPCPDCGSNKHRVCPKNCDWVEWIEPFGPNSEPVYCRVPVTTAVAKQRDAGIKARNYIYSSDEDALQDFLDANWAAVIKKESGK